MTKKQAKLLDDAAILLERSKDLVIGAQLLGDIRGYDKLRMSYCEIADWLGECLRPSRATQPKKENDNDRTSQDRNVWGEALDDHAQVDQ